jgi:hypothetical protein
LTVPAAGMAQTGMEKPMFDSVNLLVRRAAPSCVFAVAALAPICGAASQGRTLYFAPGGSGGDIYQIDWQTAQSSAVVLSPGGTASGGYADDGAQRVITLSKPLSRTWLYTRDECGTGYARAETWQLVVRHLPDRDAQTVEIGAYTILGSCQDGEVVPYGSPTDAGVAMLSRHVSELPLQDDLAPGTRIAGLSEDTPAYGETANAQDVTVLGKGELTFESTGHTHPVVHGVDGWMYINISEADQRGFRRLHVDERTGGEVWGMTQSADGVKRLNKLWVVKARRNAGFGDFAQATRSWKSGLFFGTNQRFTIRLFGDGTGERISRYLDEGTKSRSPIAAWGLDGTTLWQERDLSGYLFVRRWAPLRNDGQKIHWVMEQEARRDADNEVVVIKPRVNHYLDSGPARPGAGNLE